MGQPGVNPGSKWVEPAPVYLEALDVAAQVEIEGKN